MSDEPYYKIFIADDGLKPVCLQWFDEPHYDSTHFLSGVTFRSEEDCQSVIDGIARWLGQLLVKGRLS